MHFSVLVNFVYHHFHDEYAWHIKDGTISGGKSPTRAPHFELAERRTKLRVAMHNQMSFWGLYDHLCFASANAAGDCRQRACRETDEESTRNLLTYYGQQVNRSVADPGCLRADWAALSGGATELDTEWTHRALRSARTCSALTCGQEAAWGSREERARGFIAASSTACDALQEHDAGVRAATSAGDFRWSSWLPPSVPVPPPRYIPSSGETCALSAGSPGQRRSAEVRSLAAPVDGDWSVVPSLGLVFCAHRLAERLADEGHSYRLSPRLGAILKARKRRERFGARFHRWPCGRAARVRPFVRPLVCPWVQSAGRSRSP